VSRIKNKQQIQKTVKDMGKKKPILTRSNGAYEAAKGISIHKCLVKSSEKGVPHQSSTLGVAKQEQKKITKLLLLLTVRGLNLTFIREWLAEKEQTKRRTGLLRNGPYMSKRWKHREKISDTYGNRLELSGIDRRSPARRGPSLKGSDKV